MASRTRLHVPKILNWRTSGNAKLIGIARSPYSPAAINYFNGLRWKILKGTGVSIAELAIDFKTSQSVLLSSQNCPLSSAWQDSTSIFLAMIRKLNLILGKQVHPGELKNPTYRLFTLTSSRNTGIIGARPIFQARQQVEDVLLKVAKTRIDKPRFEKGIFHITPLAPTMPSTMQTGSFSLAPRRVTGKSVRHLVSSGPL